MSVEGDLRAEIYDLNVVIRALVQRAGGQVSIPRHELEAAPGILLSWRTPADSVLMLSVQESNQPSLRVVPPATVEE